MECIMTLFLTTESKLTMEFELLVNSRQWVVQPRNVDS
jgi:hypothetical protein